MSRPQGEPYTGTKPETVDTAKGTPLTDATATPYLIGSILLAFGMRLALCLPYRMLTTV